MIAERMKDALINSKDKETIQELDQELAKIIEKLMRAVDVETLRLARKNGRNLVSQFYCTSFSVVYVEQSFLLERLQPVKTSYDLDHCCMEGTRQFLLSQIVDWVQDTSGREDGVHGNTYWLYGSPGIGKTTLAHSICASLHDRKQLGGVFFCRRDDPHLSKHRNILPTLINTLAGVFPPFRMVVADRFRNDPILTPESIKPTLFLDLIHDLPHPPHTLAFVIDAFDECGDTNSRRVILNVLTNMAARTPWLKVIVTSRPEADIQRFFGDSLIRSSYLQYNLAADEHATSDLRVFACSRFERVAAKRHLRQWPEEPLLSQVISRAEGLFIFIETVALALERSIDPNEFLKATLQDATGTRSKSLYNLYSSILERRTVVDGNLKFQRMIGVLLTAAPHRPLCEETIAELARVELHLVETWVDDLSSLLYRDEKANGTIRIRHLSISDFFESEDCHCDYRVNRQDANRQLGIACLETMLAQLHFNICKLEDSRVANADVKDLASCILENISDALQYGCLYWSNHICFIAGDGDGQVRGCLKEFFGGLYPLFWMEVLSILGMVPVGVPSLRRVRSWAKVSIAAVCYSNRLENSSNLL